MKYKNSLPIIALLLAPVTTAYGQLMAIPTRTTVEAMSQHRTIQVYNSGDKPLYLNIALQRVENPGMNPEKKTPISDISQPEIIFNPSRITLGPKQKRDIKLLPLKPPEQETLYRLYIDPVVNIKAVGNGDKSKIHAPMTISIGYGVLIHHVPPAAEQTHHWQHQCTADGLILSSTGNVHSKFAQLKSPDDTALADSLNLYRGAPVTLSVKQLSGRANNETFTINCR
ncbi:fimbria/pilus periplasmic chaperone [Yersinia hibernica]|uniref:Pilus assembly protein n=1 Tax=Yersinia enterocolitica LC20 TaxID=1443113 RepID=A0A7U4K2T8_YEREN|nr:fimbria/pilus periplasmic chaperone [Yersinia hibernica]AHM76252.1 pilus assembly protein [Yersinia hibernica]OVZ94662.1 pilus assembly protein [Yersinia kristensenii]